MTDTPPNYGPIFIVGMNGSGTTMLLDHLNSHSEIYGFPEETRILPHYIQNSGKFGDISVPGHRKRMWHELCGAFPFWKANGECPVTIPENWAEVGESPAVVFDYILSLFATQSGKRVWCEKTPMHAMHIAALGAAFPTSRFIHILRDGRDCAASFSRRWGYNAKVSIYRWRKTIRTARMQSQSVGLSRYKELYFESLTTNPHTVLSDLCDFLGVQFEDSMLTANRTTERVGGVGSYHMTMNSGKYRTYFSDSEINGLEEIAGSLLHELGYSVHNKDGNKDLASSFVWFHQTIAQIRRIPNIVSRARSSGNPFRLLLSRIRSGFKYRKSSQL